MIDNMRRVYAEVLKNKKRIRYTPSNPICFRDHPTVDATKNAGEWGFVIQECGCPAHVELPISGKSYIKMCLAINVTEYVPERSKWE